MSVLVLCGGTVFAQSQLDAYKYSQTDLTGTARYLSMGGAFGALGGDISSIKTNPAGLAIYRSSEVVTTVSVSSVESKTNWLGTKLDNTRTKMGFDNIAYVSYYPTGDDEGIVSWNIGLSYNRVKNYSRNYTMSAGGSMHTSLSDYVAERAYGTSYGSFEGSSAYDTQGDWLSVLGYNAGYIDAYQSNSSMYYSSFGDYNTSGEWENYLLEKGELKVAERGSVDLYNVGFGVNISDRVMLGAAVAVWDLNYRYSSMYDETFTNGNDFSGYKENAHDKEVVDILTNELMAKIIELRDEDKPKKIENNSN